MIGEACEGCLGCFWYYFLCAPPICLNLEATGETPCPQWEERPRIGELGDSEWAALSIYLAQYLGTIPLIDSNEVPNLMVLGEKLSKWLKALPLRLETLRKARVEERYPGALLEAWGNYLYLLAVRDAVSKRIEELESTLIKGD